MNINLGDKLDVQNLVKRALPEESRDRNVAVLEDNWTTGSQNHNDPGFLSDDFPRNPPKLYVTAESDDFDAQTLSDWRNEGFDATYLPMGEDLDAYRRELQHLASDKKLGPCETFGLVAYGDAASFCLEHYHVLDNNPGLKLGCLIAYYPTRIPDPNTRFPSAIRVLVHLVAGEEVGIVKQTQMVGIQGKKRVSKRKVDRGIGTGGSLQMGYPGYSYDSEPGFAEHDLDEYDPISAELAWSRSLQTARRAFRVDAKVESMLETNTQNKFFSRDVQQTMSTYTADRAPHVTHVPTLTGGIGTEELQDFYTHYFINSNPPSLKLILVSRTIGADRAVDEMFVTFKHTQEMPWILPGVPPTNKRVEIMMVVIVALRGGKLYHEHVYWDHASVLFQVGLLDPKLLPAKARELGINRLPVVGKTAARRILDGMDATADGEADNGPIYGDQDGGAESSSDAKKVESGASDKEQKGRG